MHPETENKSQSNIFIIYLLGFLFTLHAALPSYVTSTFLARFTSENFVGIMYTFSALLTIGAFTLIPRVLRKFGNYKTAMGLLIIDLLSILGLAFVKNEFLIYTFFITGFVTVALIGFNIDIFLESFSRDATTGKIRGTFLSTANTAWIIAPLVGSMILTDGDYWKIFLAAALLILPILFFVHNNLKKFKDPEYKIIPLKNTAGEIARNKDIRDIFIVGFLLQFFYSWMVIYTPIYLYTHIGFSWREIGIIFSIMLLPFVLTEAPLGRLADRRWGEKEVMSIGFIVMAISTGLIAFIEIKSIALWAALLFITRIGAAMVEIMSETYFFKKVHSSKADIIGLFRTMRPWAYIVSPVLAIALFSVDMPIKYIFVVLAVIMFLGLHWSLELKDTR
ncbi:MAG: Major facilitator superfamily [Parcubacteria group bacterium GW2011_GWA2_47_16]|nr:MAG: Major facilitator superfamily [Parcubacteria group bacterium GW2011_GWA2_47_16]